MRLNEAVDGVALWQYAERYLGVGTRTYSPYAADLDIADAYHPQRGAASFDVPTFRVPPHLGTFLDRPGSSPLGSLYRDGAGFLLPVHPNALDYPELPGRAELQTCDPGPVLRVVPSANARTVFVHTIDGAEVAEHFVKLHYPRRLSRFTRRLRQPVIKLQLWVAEELLRAGVPVLPEPAGGYFGDGDDAWGFLIRDAEPHGVSRLPGTVPFFALYGGDYHHPGDPTLLEQLVHLSGEDAAAFIADRIVVPAVRLWTDAAVRAGVSLEPHGQNTLLTFDPENGDTAVFYRDCAVFVDAAARIRLGVPGALPDINVIGRDIHEEPAQVQSLGYDSFLGHHTLSYIAKVAQERLGVAEERLHRAAREAFSAGIGGMDPLPQTRFYYENRLYSNSAWRLVDTGETPHWR